MSDSLSIYAGNVLLVKRIKHLYDLLFVGMLESKTSSTNIHHHFVFFFFKFLDGGIARLRVYGIALKDWAQILSKKVFNVTKCRGNFHTFELLEYLSGKHTNCLQKIIIIFWRQLV